MFVAQQHSIFSGFAYDFLEPSGLQVGTLTWPAVAVARNARLKNHVPRFLSTKLEIKHQGQAYAIEFEYLSREWSNHIGFSLKDGDTTLASAHVGRTSHQFKRPTITLTAPFEGLVIRKSSLFTTRYEVTRGATVIGSIASEARLTLKRKLFIDLPDDIPAPVQFFLFFLVCNHAYR